MHDVEQLFSHPRIADPATAAREATLKIAADEIRPGQRVAVPVGSRGIVALSSIVRSIVRALSELGAEPFIVPAMGSHGGGTGEGQRRVLETLGVTDASVGAPVIASMETVPIGMTPEGIPVVMDARAAQADHILVVNRIKPHTEFGGPLQSGLTKMLLIGLGKHEGAIGYHRAAMELSFETVIRSAARVVLDKAPVLGGIAIIENANEEVAEIVPLRAADLLTTEPALLQRAAGYMAAIPFDNVDLLIVDEIGKDISGSGMDTNVIRRKHWADTQIGEVVERNAPKRIYVRDLTDATEGNAAGIGLADFALESILDRVDWRKTRINAVTATRPRGAMVPIVCANDVEAIEMALASAGVGAVADARVVRVCDTLHLRHLQASKEAVAHLCPKATVRVTPASVPLQFDGCGMLIPRKLRRQL